MYSICRIWRMHQPGEQVTALGTPAVPEIALVCRLARRVEVTRVEPGKASFLDACAAGASLEEANAAATGVDPDFDIRRSLAGFVQSGTIVGLASP
jgi:hypothetical protein